MAGRSGATFRSRPAHWGGAAARREEGCSAGPGARRPAFEIWEGSLRGEELDARVVAWRAGGRPRGRAHFRARPRIAALGATAPGALRLWPCLRAHDPERVRAGPVG